MSYVTLIKEATDLNGSQFHQQSLNHVSLALWVLHLSGFMEHPTTFDHTTHPHTPSVGTGAGNSRALCSAGFGLTDNSGSSTSDTCVATACSGTFTQDSATYGFTAGDKSIPPAFNTVCHRRHSVVAATSSHRACAPPPENAHATWAHKNCAERTP